MSKENLQIKEVSDFIQLGKYSDSWNMLAIKSSQQNPTLSYPWISAYLKTCIVPGESWFCIFAFENNTLVGVLPLIRNEYRLIVKKYWNLRTPGDDNTVSGDILFDDNYGEQVIQLFFNYLNELRPKAIKLKFRVKFNSETYKILQNHLPGINASCYFPDLVTSIISVDGPFSSFKNKLPRKFISNIRRANNSLIKLGNISFIVIKGNKNFEENLEIFTALERSGWKGRRGSSIKDKYWEFYNKLVHNMAENGWIEWYFLKLGEQYLAGYFAIPFGRTIYLYKTGYNEEFSRHSPGVILTEKMLEHIFSTAKYDTIDFISEYNWIKRWTIVTQPYYVITIPFKNKASFFLTQLPYYLYSRLSIVRRVVKIIKEKTL
jgi:hypothetical protein